jgi:hypothetical protein
MSTKKDIFIAIRDRIKEELPDVWVDKNMGQIATIDRFDSFPLPAVLVEFGQSEYKTVSKGVQGVKTVLRFHLLFENWAASHAESEDSELALRYFDFTEAVHEALEGFGGENFASLTRVADEEDNNHESVVITVVEYALSYVDSSKADSHKTTEVNPDLIVEHKKPPLRPQSNFTKPYFVPD